MQIIANMLTRIYYIAEKGHGKLSIETLSFKLWSFELGLLRLGFCYRCSSDPNINDAA